MNGFARTLLWLAGVAAAGAVLWVGVGMPLFTSEGQTMAITQTNSIQAPSASGATPRPSLARSPKQKREQATAEVETPVTLPPGPDNKTSLEDRLERVEREISSLRSTLQRLSDAMGDGDSAAAHTALEWEDDTPWRDEALEESLHAQFRAEHIDIRWNQEAETRILDAWSPDPNSGSELTAFECRAFTCRAVVEHNDNSAQEDFLQEASRRAPWSAPMTVLTTETDGGPMSTLFIAREGYDVVDSENSEI